MKRTFYVLPYDGLNGRTWDVLRRRKGVFRKASARGGQEVREVASIVVRSGLASRDEARAIARKLNADRSALLWLRLKGLPR